MSKRHLIVPPRVILLIALVVSSFFINAYNIELFGLLNSLHSNLSDAFWVSMTTMGDGLLLGIILGMFIIVNPRITVFGLLLLLSASITVNFIKAIVPELRPAETLGAVHFVGPVLRSGSFPSGHSAAAFATALSIAHFSSSRALKVCLLLFGTLVGLSRIFIGAHFPNDVVWGIIVALILYEVLCEFLWPRIEFFVPDSPSIHNGYFRAALALEVALSLFCLVVYSQMFAEYPPAAIAVSSGVLTFFVIAFVKIVKNY